MRNLKSLLIAVVLLAFFMELNLVWADSKQLSIVPEPVSVKVTDGTFNLNADTAIVAEDKTGPLARQLVEMLKPATGFGLKVKSSASKNCIELKIDDSLKNLTDEGYRLDVIADKVVIGSASTAGIFYGMQTLRQLLPTEIFSADKVTGIDWSIPCVEIEDYPRFGWRGLHLDVSRHFFDADFIKKYIDLLAVHKMNVFHWHIVDGQGWRMEVKKYPKLTEIGAWRSGKDGVNWKYHDMKFPGKSSGQDLYGGYYTQEQIKEIVQYAKKRFVTIVPEIEMPGHSWAALIAYPEFVCSQTKPGPDGHHNQNVFCAGKESTFKFLEDVLDETMELFDSEYIHIGGDEVGRGFWQNCDDCKKRMEAEGLEDYDQLQSYFIKRMEKYVNSKGRKVIGWDEILQGGLAPNAAVMSWRGMGGGIAAAKSGHDVVMAPVNPVYLDAPQADPAGEPKTIGYAPNTLKKVYNFEPVPVQLTEQEAKHVLGAQAQAWTEWMFDSKRVEYMVYPRGCALSEVVWSPKDKKDFAGFHNRMTTHVNRLAAMDVNYRKLDPIPVIIGQWKSGQTSEDYKVMTWDITGALKTAGDYVFKFVYTGGAHRLDIEWIQILENDKVVSEDRHLGVTGAGSKNNSYNVSIDKIVKSAAYTLKAHVRSDGGSDSNGEIEIAQKK